MTTPNDQSETPRTDLAKFSMPMSWIATTERTQLVVSAETAERMEKELADLRTQLAVAQRERETLKQTIDAVITASKWDGCDGLSQFVEQIRIEKDEAQQWIDSEPEWKDKYNAQMSAVIKERDEYKSGFEKYAVSARVIHLHLKAFCNRDLTPDEMIADAARKAASQVSELQRDRERLNAIDLLCEGYGCSGEHEGNRWVIDGPFSDIRVAADDLIKRAAMRAKGEA